MKRFLKVLAKIFGSLFAPAVWKALLQGIEVASPYLKLAYQFAETAATMTPNRTDDEIIALAEKLGVPDFLEPGADRGKVIGQIVFRALQLAFPGVPDRILNRAIEIAYGGVNP